MAEHFSNVNPEQALFAFFGTDDFAVLVLEELKRQGLVPEMVVTGIDRPSGRGLAVTPPPTKVWAMANEIEYSQPRELNDAFREHLTGKGPWDVFLVASYGRILPTEILDIPKNGTLNIHPSLLPDLRGAAPIENAILFRDATGVTLIKMDEKMDHGPIIAKEEVAIEGWPPQKAALEAVLARKGGALFAETLSDWLAGRITPREQDHERATFTKKITKQDAFIDLSENPAHNYRKIQAFHEWPKPYLFVYKGDRSVRVIITEAEFEDGSLEIRHVIPEGKKEMSFDDFLRGGYEIPDAQNDH